MSGSTVQNDASDWDEDKASQLLNSIVLVGLTYVDNEGRQLEQMQFYGIVTAVDRSEGISLEVHGETYRGQTRRLPPDTSAFDAADRGTYRLRTTGEEIVDPDYVTSWTVTRPQDQPQ